MLSFESPVQTVWHPIPLVWKFTAVCLSSLLLFIYDAVVVQAVALAICCILYLMGGLTFSIAGVKRLWFLWPMILIILVWHVLTHTTQQGLSIVLRLLVVVALSNLMTMTATLTELIDLARRALAPLRIAGINTRPIELAMALAVRFTPILVHKSSLLADAWRLRATSRASWRLIFPLTLLAIDDAEQVAEALKARGGTHFQQ